MLSNQFKWEEEPAERTTSVQNLVIQRVNKREFTTKNLPRG